VRWPGLEGPVRSELPPSFAAVARGDTSASHLGLALCRDRRGAWLERITDAFRAVHRDEITQLPASIDIYGRWFNAVWYDETADPRKAAARLDPVLRQIMKIHDLQGGVVRTHRRNPHQSGLVGKVRVVGETPPDTFTVTEHGLQYEINLLTTQHTGLFLDQRDTRRRLALLAQSRRVANLFAFTCSFSVAAAAARCEVVFSVDNARACLNTGKANFALNGLEESGRGKFVQEDVRKWLARQLRRQAEDPQGYPYLDLVVCDPPVFAASKDGGKFAVEKEWPALAGGLHTLMAADSVAVFANNHRGGKHGFYRRELEKHFALVVSLRPPLDFPVAEGRPHHVRTFWCRKSTRQGEE
jgi:23S rRNA (cytosine1962-C5)-methyltransferase